MTVYRRQLGTHKEPHSGGGGQESPFFTTDAISPATFGPLQADVVTINLETFWLLPALTRLRYVWSEATKHNTDVKRSSSRA